MFVCLFVCILAFMHIRIFVYLYVSIFVYVYIVCKCICSFICIWICICIIICLCICMCICLCVCLCICICQAISAQVESFGVNPQYGLQDGVCCPGCSRCLGRLASTARHCLAPPEATDEGHSSTFGVVALSGRLRRRPPHGIGEPSRGSTS